MTAARRALSAAPTYGELVDDTQRLLLGAFRTGCGPFPDPAAAVDATLGFRRFLAVAGRHLRLLAAPGHNQAWSQANYAGSILHTLLPLLVKQPLHGGRPTPWSDAADRLGLAHDVIATHLGPAGEQRTPEAATAAAPAARLDAAGRVLDLLEATARLGHELTIQAGVVLTLGRPSRAQSDELRSLARLAPILEGLVTNPALRAALTNPDNPPVSMDAMTPALAPGAGLYTDEAFEAALAAMRTLRIITFRQAKNGSPANTSTLRDLARVAVCVNERAAIMLSPTSVDMDKHDTPNTALLEARRAGREWLTARDHLGPEVRGLDLAPRAYADSVRILLSPAGVGRGGSVVRALLAALPELGHEAAATVERLAANNRLVLATREPCRFLPVWRPLLPDEAEPIARSFETAAEASTRLNTSLEVASRPRPQSLDVQITRRQPSQHLSVVR